MVVFTCNHCGESLQKPKVEKHYLTVCKNSISLTCMDCFKDFKLQEYVGHTKCITEEQRYSAKGTVQSGAKKGEMKQLSWMTQINEILETRKDTLKPNEKKILELISSTENVPRKKSKFVMTYYLPVRGSQLNDNKFCLVWILSFLFIIPKPMAFPAEFTVMTLLQNFMKSTTGGRVSNQDIEAVWNILEAQKKEKQNDPETKQDSGEDKKTSEQEENSSKEPNKSDPDPGMKLAETEELTGSVKKLKKKKRKSETAEDISAKKPKEEEPEKVDEVTEKVPKKKRKVEINEDSEKTEEKPAEETPKKKKKKSKKDEEITLEGKVEEGVVEEEKKKKKKKEETGEEKLEDAEEKDDKESGDSKKKKKKQKEETAENYMKDAPEDQELVQEEGKKKKKKKHKPAETEGSQTDEMIVQKTEDKETGMNGEVKKKKKKQKEEDNDQGDEIKERTVEKVNGINVDEGKKKKKKKHTTEEGKEMIQPEGAELEVKEENQNTEKKKKKQKRKAEEVEVVQEAKEDTEKTEETPKKKKKKDKLNKTEVTANAPQENGVEKKKKNKESTGIVNGHTENADTQDDADGSKVNFSWNDVILEILKDRKTIPKEELQKEVTKKYTETRGEEPTPKQLKNYNKKLKKIPGIQMINDICSYIN